MPFKPDLFSSLESTGKIKEKQNPEKAKRRGKTFVSRVP